MLGGQVNYSGTVANDGVTPSAFGLSTSAIVMNPGTSSLLLWATAASVINRDIMVTGSGPGVADIGTSGTTYTVTVNGNVALGRVLALDAGTTATTGMIVNGVISGTGSLTDGNSSFNTLNGANTYSGGTNIQTGTYAAGVSSTGTSGAFGTGTISFSGAGKIQSTDTTARTIDNNVFLAANPTFQGTGALNFTGGVNLNGARSLGATDTAATGVALSGVVSNGSLTKTGTGVLSLNSSTGNTYTGGTVLSTSAGTLNVNNSSGSGTGAGTVSIGGTSTSNRSTLSGNFTIAGATSDTGVLSPGNGATRNGVGDIGTANFASSFSLSSNSVVTLELASSFSSDEVNVGGLLTLGGSIFNVTTIGGYQAVAGDTFDLVDWGTLGGTATISIAGATLADPVNTSWDTSSFLVDGTIRVVPEPSTIALGVFGGLALVGAVRRRRA